MDAVGIAFEGVGEGGAAAGAVNDGGEAFLPVLDEGQVFDKLCLFFGYGHLAGQPWAAATPSGPRSFSKRALSVAFM